MMTFKQAIGTALVAASVITLATAAPADARNGRNAAAIGAGVAAGPLHGAAAASNSSYYYGQPAYRSYNYYEPAPTYYEPAPTYYYGAPAYRGSYGYYNGRSGPQNSRSSEQQRIQTGP